MNSIVVPLDGSVRSEQALGTAERLARQLDRRLELIRVIDPDKAGSIAWPECVDRTRRYLESIAHRFVHTVPVETHVIEGNDPAAEIIDHVRATGGNYIVMSTRGLGAIGALVFGSVADDVVRHAHVPVVLVRGEAATPAEFIQRLILPLDGSLLAEQALPQAAELARETDATISLVQVIDLPPETVYADFGPPPGMVYESVERAREDARSYLNTMANRLRRNGIRTTWEVRVGAAATEITRAATTTGAGLIVMSTHGRTGLRRIALGSVALEVVRSGTTPVMIVPATSPSTLNGANHRIPSSASS
ncbi:MAG TPA: universal stress protein [Nitrolancea sp.]|nr:universal stress protein [Nitrolancea sp.]